MSKKRLPMLKTPVIGRFCWECEHVYYSAATPSYSEVTPGGSMSLSCEKDYWNFDQYDDSVGQLGNKLRTAETCADFLLSSRR